MNLEPLQLFIDELETDTGFVGVVVQHPDPSTLVGFSWEIWHMLSRGGHRPYAWHPPPVRFGLGAAEAFYLVPDPACSVQRVAAWLLEQGLLGDFRLGWHDIQAGKWLLTHPGAGAPFPFSPDAAAVIEASARIDKAVIEGKSRLQSIADRVVDGTADGAAVARAVEGVEEIVEAAEADQARARRTLTGGES